MSKAKKKPRCEGFHRHGGAFTLGPVKWTQCEQDATVMLEFERDHNVKKLPACPDCWKKCIENKINILEATPL